MQIFHSRELSQILEWVAHYRGIALDTVEQEFGDTHKWPTLRSRLLKIFGDRGLEEKITKVLSGEGIGEP